MPAVFECRSTQYNPSIRRSLPGCDRAPRVVSANVYRQKASTRVAKNCWPRASLRNRVNEPDNSRESVYLWTIVGEGWAVLATSMHGKSAQAAPKWKDRSPANLRPPVNDMGEPTEWV